MGVNRMAKKDKPLSPSLTEKTLSVRIPDEKHRALKSRCVAEGVSIRAVLLAVIGELENDTPTGRKIMAAAETADD